MTTPKRHVMIDLETLGVTPDSVILTIGAIKFDPWDDSSTLTNRENIQMDCFYHRIDPESFGPDARIDDGTLAWWASQNEDVRAEAFAEDNRIPIRTTLTDFYKWLGKFDCVWSNGATFDIVMLEWAYRAQDKGIPWKYWQARDTRTVFGMVKDHKQFMPEQALSMKHHALWDCWVQLVTVQNIIRSLNIPRPE